MFYPPDDATAGEPRRAVERALTTGRSEDESWRVRKDGARFWANEIMRPLRDSAGHIVGVARISRDLTERKALEDALQQERQSLEQRVRERTAEVQALFQRLVSAQEEERRRIARDIHDQLGQQMTALRMNIETLQSQSDGHAALVEQAERTQQLAEELDQSIDFLTWQLRPAALDHLGLSAALRNLVTGWSERFGVQADFDVLGVEDVRLRRDVEANLYRIAQEALHNIAKHAGATRATVVLTQQDGHLALVIEDNGRGFHGGQTFPQGRDTGLGLVSMRERAALVGGRLEIDSSADRGTSIYVRIPDTHGAHDVR
jgi:signal transduction histidine kinase